HMSSLNSEPGLQLLRRRATERFQPLLPRRRVDCRRGRMPNTVSAFFFTRPDLTASGSEHLPPAQARGKATALRRPAAARARSPPGIRLRHKNYLSGSVIKPAPNRPEETTVLPGQPSCPRTTTIGRSPET